MPKYTDEDIRKLNKITLKIAGDYLGISSLSGMLKTSYFSK